MKKQIFSYAIVLIGIFLFYQNTPVYAAGPTIVTKDITTPTTWTKGGSPYVINPQFETLYVFSRLTIEPGVVVKFYDLNKNLNIGGSLTAIGTPEEKIIFTSYKDDMFGGDTNNDGSSSVPKNGDWSAIINNGQAIFENTTLLYGSSSPGTGAIFSYSNNLTVRNSTIQYATYSGIALYNAPGVTIENNIITNNGTGISIASFISGTSTKISHNVIANNNYGAWVFGLIWWRPEFPLDARDNWWGDASGPKHLRYNPLGKGNSIGDGILFNPQLDHDPSVVPAGCTEDCYSNVLFLPGLEASRLYDKDDPNCSLINCENQLWEPNRNDDGEKLFLNENGKSINPDVYTKDVLDEVNVSQVGQKNIYKSLLADLDKWKNEEKIIVDYSAIPYDWRLSLEDILAGGAVDGEKIFYTEKSIAPYIVRELRRLAGTSKTGKVTIIAHSNGGLVAKALTHMLGSEAEKLIDNIVLVAVPQVGTPQSIGAILHGYDQGLPTDLMPWILSQKTARTLAQNMPSAYHLLPSKAYFGGNGSATSTPVISFRDGLLTNPFIKKYGNDIHTEEALRSFLLDSEGKVSADSSDVIRPSRVNTKLFNLAGDVHDALDNFTFPASISIYQIAGFGEETLGTIRYFTGESCSKSFRGWCLESEPKLEYSPEMVIDGDGTVVTPSALSMDTNDVVKRYWVDLWNYNIPLIRNVEHVDIFEIPELRDFIKNNIITQSLTHFPEYISDSEPSITLEKRLRYYLHSPLALSIQDASGHETSGTVSTIQGAQYKRFGEVQYISVPAEVHPTVFLDGTADGSFTLEIQETDNDVVTATTLFTGIPNTAHTRATMAFPDGSISHAGPLIIDYDGDGMDDHNVMPILNGTALLQDTTPPRTILSSTGTTGTNDWYTSDVIVTLTSEDDQNGSGVAKTEYSLDNGASWTPYTTSLTLSDEGMITIQYFSTDISGNKEAVQTETIKRDKTAPEAKIFFNPETQKLDVIGIDNLGESVSVVNTESVIRDKNKPVLQEHHWYDRFDWNRDKSKKEEKGKQIITTTLVDQAGHTTVIVSEEKENDKNQLKRNLQSLSYDGVSVEVRDVSIQYEWQKNWRGAYTMLNSQFNIPMMNLESHYSQKKNETWITREIRELYDEDSEDDSKEQKTKEQFTGMIIPSMMTEKGKADINY